MSRSTIRRIFELAERLEPDRKIVWDWLFHTRVEVLGGHTPLELVFDDQGERVVRLLEAAVSDEAEAAALPSRAG